MMSGWPAPPRRHVGARWSQLLNAARTFLNGNLRPDPSTRAKLGTGHGGCRTRPAAHSANGGVGKARKNSFLPRPPFLFVRLFGLRPACPVGRLFSFGEKFWRRG